MDIPNTHYNLVELKIKTKNFSPTQHQIWVGAKTSKGGESKMNKLTSSPSLPILILTLAWKSALLIKYNLVFPPLIYTKIPLLFRESAKTKKRGKPKSLKKTFYHS